MAGAGAGGEPGPPAAGAAGTLAPGDPDWRDWAGGLPADVLAKVAETLAEGNRADWAAHLLGTRGYKPDDFARKMAKREQEGPSGLLAFALVCKEWRKAQLKVGGRLRTRVESDVILPGQVALVKWALAEGCPRENEDGGVTLAYAAAGYGHLELVQWLIQEQGFAMGRKVMAMAARGGNLELVRWLRGEG